MLNVRLWSRTPGTPRPKAAPAMSVGARAALAGLLTLGLLSGLAAAASPARPQDGGGAGVRRSEEAAARAKAALAFLQKRTNLRPDAPRPLTQDEFVPAAAVPESATTVFAHTYGASGNDVLFPMTLGDQTYLLSGSTDSFSAVSGQFALWLMHVSATGSVLWSGTLDDIENGGATPTSDGNLLVFGQVRAGVMGSPAYYWLAKMDTSGNVIWQNTYGTVPAMGAPVMSAYQTAAGTILVQFANYMSSTLDLVGLTSGGAVSWQTTLPEGNGFLYPTYVAADGTLYLTGDTDLNTASSSDFWLVKLGPTGSVQMSKTYGGNAEEDSGALVPFASGGGFAFYGDSLSFASGAHSVWVLRIDSSGNVTWQKDFADPTGFLGDPTVFATSDGGLLVSAIRRDNAQSVTGTPWVFKLNGSGTVVWQQAYATGGSSALTPEAETTNGNYLLEDESTGTFLVVDPASGGILEQTLYKFGVPGIMRSGSNYVISGYTGLGGPTMADSFLHVITGPDISDPTCSAFQTSSATSSTISVTAAATSVTPANTALTPTTPAYSPTAASLAATPRTPSVGSVCGAAVCNFSCAGSASPTSGPAPLAVGFTATANTENCGGTPFYVWDFGDGMGMSSSQNPNYTYNNPGTYTWSLQVILPGYPTCNQSGQVTVTGPCTTPAISTQPPSQTISSGQTATLMVLASGTSPLAYQWYQGASGDTSTAVGTNSSVFTTAALTTTTSFWVRVSDPCGHSDSDTAVITVPCTLTCSASAPATGATGASILFTGTATASSCAGQPAYDWDFGDGSAHSSAQSPTHTYGAAGTYSWSMTASIQGTAPCQHGGSITVSDVTPLGVTATGSPTSGTTPLDVSFSAAASGGTPPYTYAWAFGDGAGGSGSSASHVYTAAGAFTAVVRAEDSGGQTAYASVTVQTVAPLTVSASGTPNSGITPLPVAFTAAASGGTAPYTYAWTFGDGSTGSGASPSHTYTSAGASTATVTATDSASRTASATVGITTYAPLSVGGSANPTTGNAPLAVSFNSTVSGGTGTYTVDWDFGDGSAHSALGAASHTYAAAGSYNATLTAHDSGGQSGSRTFTITVTAAPPVITLVKKVAPPFKLVVTGTNLQSGIQVSINGTPWPGVVWKKTTKIQITGGKSLKAVVPKGATTQLTFTNPDGGSATYSFTW